MKFKENMILITIIFIPIVILIIFLLMLFPPKSLAVNQHKEYFANKYNINKKEIKLVEYNKANTKKYCSGSFYCKSYKVKFPRYSIFEYNGTTFTVVNNQDDYLYEELYNGVRKYYSNKLNIEKEKIYVEIYDVYDDFESQPYIDFLYNNDIVKITSDIIEEFLNQNSEKYIRVRIKLDINDNQNEYVNKINNNKHKFYFNEEITLYSYEADLEIVDCYNNVENFYYEPLEYNFFKCLEVSSGGSNKYEIISFQGYETYQSDDSNIIYFRNGSVKQ